MGTTKVRKRLTPQTVRTQEQLLTLARDNLTVRHFWILVDETRVILAKQMSGKPVEVALEIPKVDFDEMVAFYLGSHERPHA